MNKKDLIKEIAANGNFTVQSAEAALDTVIGTVMTAVEKGDTVKLAGFGTFSSKIRNACERINPATGEKINVPEKRVPKFKFSNTFKKNIAEKP